MIKINNINTFIFILSFVTINISPLNGVDFFPFLFLFIPFLFGFNKNMLLFFSLSSAVFLFLMLYDVDLKSVIQLLVFLYFLSFLGVVVKDLHMIKAATTFLLIIHFIFLFLWFFYPYISNYFFDSRGLGRNSFFYAEPSYAAIVLFSIFILYNIAVKEIDAEVGLKDKYIYYFIVILCLFSTLSLTGFLFSIFIVIHFFMGLSFRLKLFYFMILSIFSIFIFSLMSERLGFVFEVKSFLDFLYISNMVEPSGAWRLNVNIIAYYFSIENPLGFFRFFINQDEIFLPKYLYFVFNNELFDVFDTIKGQSLFSTLMFGFGFIGFLFLFFVYFISSYGFLRLVKHKKIDYSDFFMINIFMIYGLIYQAAITSVPFLIIFSIGLFYATRSKCNYSSI